MEEDNELMQRVQEGDREAFEALVLRYRADALRKAVTYVKDPVLAEDIVQETFADIYLHRESYRPTFSFHTFLYALVRHKSIDALRRRKHLPLPMDDLPETAQTDTPESAFIRTSLYTELDRALNTLHKEQRQMLLLYALEGKPYKEIAVRMGKSVAQVKITIHRIRKQLHSIKEDWE